MTDDTNVLEHDEQEGENLNPAEPRKTPLELVKEQQAMQHESREVIENRVESGVEVPGGSKPSDRRKHPQRQMYGSGTNES
ncbi:MAG TPA: hypothetical protein VF600_12420 [Abditibacteriaceae bacterium]